MFDNTTVIDKYLIKYTKQNNCIVAQFTNYAIQNRNLSSLQFSNYNKKYIKNVDTKIISDFP